MRIRLFLSFIISIIFYLSLLSPSHAEKSQIPFGARDRVLVVAPHPDDETLGTAGVIQSALSAKAQVRVAYLTHGDHNEIASIFYQKKLLLRKSDFIKSGQIRKKEALSATSVLGLSEKDLLFLGYPDLGTLIIWRRHWGSERPFRSFLTRIDRVPYPYDFSYGSAYNGESIVSDFEKTLTFFKPTHVFVTAPFDANPDHQAAFLFLQVALLNLKERLDPPKLYLYLIHAPKWPRPRKYRPLEALKIPGPLLEKDGNPLWISHALMPDQIRTKAEALLKYESQIAYRKNFLLSFVRRNELFFEMPCQEIAPLLEENQVREGFGSPPSESEVAFHTKGGELWIEAALSAHVDEIGVLNIDLFGYRFSKGFSAMPKLNLRLLGSRVFVSKSGRGFYAKGIFYRVGGKHFVVRVPLKLLGEPEVIFASVYTAREEPSLDFGSWKTLYV